jgi:hypothetical protein
MTLRVSQIVVSLVLLDEYDAPKNADPIAFAGDAEGTAAEKLRGWVDGLPEKLRRAEESASGS